MSTSGCVRHFNRTDCCVRLRSLVCRVYAHFFPLILTRPLFAGFASLYSWLLLISLFSLSIFSPGRMSSVPRWSSGWCVSWGPWIGKFTFFHLSSWDRVKFFCEIIMLDVSWPDGRPDGMTLYSNLIKFRAHLSHNTNDDFATCGTGWMFANRVEKSKMEFLPFSWLLFSN